MLKINYPVNNSPKFSRRMIVALGASAGLALAGFLTFRLPSFGAAAAGSRLKRIKGSKNFHGKIFENEEHTPMMNGDASYPKMISKMLQKDPLREPQKSLPSVKPTFLAPPNDDTYRITWFGHSSYLLQIAGKNIMVDPVFSERPSPFQFMGVKRFLGTDFITANDLPAIDLLIQTHDHYDHLDYETMVALKGKIKKIVAPLGVAAHLEKWGINSEIITELDWSESFEPFEGISLTSATARHFSGRGLTNRATTLWSSFILKTPHKTIYIGGDSGYGKHFKEIGEKYGPFDLSILECGQYNEWWHYIHMFPEETVQAHLDLTSKVLFPVHWGKFALAYHPWQEPIERLTKKAQTENVSVITPKLGELVDSTKLENAQTSWWKA